MKQANLKFYEKFILHTSDFVFPYLTKPTQLHILHYVPHLLLVYLFSKITKKIFIFEN